MKPLVRTIKTIETLKNTKKNNQKCNQYKTTQCEAQLGRKLDETQLYLQKQLRKGESPRINN